jgi:DNA helicase-2/ATP-dependent DNA helicase PcrA
VSDFGRRSTLRQIVKRLILQGSEEMQGNGVRLMSLHAAKGLEFSAVFMPGMEEGLLPHRRSLNRNEHIEEERRLCYVGMTRARRHLYFTYAHFRMLGGQALIGHPSRFIAEMGRQQVRFRSSTRYHAKSRLHSVSVGDRVAHARWGSGSVTAVEGEGRAALVTIHFDEGGRHKLQLFHAPLRRQEEHADVLAG